MKGDEKTQNAFQCKALCDVAAGEKRREKLLGPWPKGLRRNYAAHYVGISPSKFDDWVNRGIMPKPKRQDGVVLWIRDHLDFALEALPEEQEAADPYKDQAL